MISASDIVSVGAGSPINLNWELVSHCQYNCSYCYYKPFKSNTDYQSVSKIVLKKLKNITDSTKVTLLGGEPTLHPDFHSIIDSLFEMSHVEQICVVSNFIKPLEFWMKLKPYSSKLKIVISYHPEYQQKEFIQKILELQDHFLLDLVFIVHNDLSLLPSMKEMASQLPRINRNKISINFVRVHEKGSYRTYPSEIEAFMQEEQERTRSFENTEKIEITTRTGKFQIPKFDVVNHQLNQFEGWKCDLRAFIIHEDGMVSSACRNKKKHILVTDFKSEEITCSYKICECDDYWNFPKKQPTQAANHS